MPLNTLTSTDGPITRIWSLPGYDPLPDPAVYEIKAAPLGGIAGPACASLSLRRRTPCHAARLARSAQVIRHAPVTGSRRPRTGRGAAERLARVADLPAG